jgi:hypothetical protein
MSIRRAFRNAMFVAAAASISLSAMADLARVGPTDAPAPPGHGFPFWYQDLKGLVLDLCLPDANDLLTGAPQGLRAQETACLLGPPQPDAPFTFPTTFPDEMFYFRAVSDPIDMTGGKRAVIVLALEAAFANGAPAVGDQMVFTRIRVTAGVPRAGTYTVTHPYGVETFSADAGVGNRDIVFSEDVGLVARVFTDALTSRFGPFLLRSSSAGGPALDPVTVNGAKFLSDGLQPEFVTGSPFGTDYVMICGKDSVGADIVLGTFGAAGPNTGICAGTNLFALTGRYHDTVANPIGSPLTIDRATYARDANGTRVDVHASVAKVLPSQPDPLLSAASADITPVRLVGPDALGRYFAQNMAIPSGVLPTRVMVINSADNPPTAVTAGPVDVVSITSATFDAALGNLTVVASSSDKGFGVSSPAPTLTLGGYPAAASTATGDSTVLTVTGLTVAPTSVVVQSENGGIARAEVASTSLGTFAAGSPLAIDDSATAQAVNSGTGTPVTFSLTANDRTAAGTSLNTASVAILAPGLTPNLGALVYNGDGTVTFTPNILSGVATFKYTVMSTGVLGASNPATVAITVAPPAGGPVPIANPDGPVNVNPNSSVTIDVLVNDSGNGGTLDKSTVAVSNATGGTVTGISATTGAVTFASGATSGTFGFDYTVKNTNGNTSLLAHVTVTVVPAETLTVAAGGECRRQTNRWRLNGTSTVSAGNSVTLYATGTVSLQSAANRVGSAPVDALGNWSIDVSGGPTCTTLASVASALGTKVGNIAIRLK